MLRPTIEDALREIQHKAAMLRYLADAASINPEQPDPAVLSGLAFVCDDIRLTAARMARSMSVEALSEEITDAE